MLKNEKQLETLDREAVVKELRYIRYDYIDINDKYSVAIIDKAIELLQKEE